jgi:hypothetical protein
MKNVPKHIEDLGWSDPADYKLAEVVGLRPLTEDREETLAEFRARSDGDMDRRLPDPDESLLDAAHEASEQERTRWLGVDRPGPQEDRPAEAKIGPYVHLVNPFTDMPVTESTPTYEKLCNLKLPLAQWALWEGQLANGHTDDTKSLVRGEAKRPYMDQGKFYMVPSWVNRELIPVMKPRLIPVLLVFYQLADQAGCFKISQRRLAEKTGIARGHLQSLVKLLVDSTVVQIPKKGLGHRVHRYRLAPVEEINLRFVRKTLWKTAALSKRPKHDGG